MKTPPPSTDSRPRFGWCHDLDNDPQIIAESGSPETDQSVAVIPLPFLSLKIKKQVREFTQSLWPKS